MSSKCKLVKIKGFRSFDFGDIEGTRKTQKFNKKINSIMVNDPDLAIGLGGESFNQAASRSINEVSKILKKGGDSLIVSHNSILNIIDLWDKTGQNDLIYLESSFRRAYASNNVKKNTGSYFKIKKKNGGTVYLVRHGDTEDTVKDVYSTKNGKLTKEGVNEAKKLARYFRNKKITCVYTSDLLRAVKTSQIILKAINEQKEGR